MSLQIVFVRIDVRRSIICLSIDWIFVDIAIRIFLQNHDHHNLDSRRRCQHHSFISFVIIWFNATNWKFSLSFCSFVRHTYNNIHELDYEPVDFIAMSLHRPKTTNPSSSSSRPPMSVPPVSSPNFANSFVDRNWHCSLGSDITLTRCVSFSPPLSISKLSRTTFSLSRLDVTCRWCRGHDPIVQSPFTVSSTCILTLSVHLLYCLPQKLQKNSPTLSNLLKYDPVQIVSSSTSAHISSCILHKIPLVMCLLILTNNVFSVTRSRSLLTILPIMCTPKKRWRCHQESRFVMTPFVSLWFLSLHRICHPFSCQLIG